MTEFILKALAALALAPIVMLVLIILIGIASAIIEARRPKSDYEIEVRKALHRVDAERYGPALRLEPWLKIIAAAAATALAIWPVSPDDDRIAVIGAGVIVAAITWQIAGLTFRALIRRRDH